MKKLLAKLAPYRKAVVAVVGLIAQAVALGLVPAADVKYATALVAAATALGVYGVSNKPAA